MTVINGFLKVNSYRHIFSNVFCSLVHVFLIIILSLLSVRFNNDYHARGIKYQVADIITEEKKYTTDLLLLIINIILVIIISSEHLSI